MAVVEATPTDSDREKSASAPVPVLHLPMAEPVSGCFTVTSSIVSIAARGSYTEVVTAMKITFRACLSAREPVPDNLILKSS